MADRIELLRFPDSQEWINPQYLLQAKNQYGNKEINHFFQHIRPALEQILKYHDDVWLSHVLEVEDNKNVGYYPKQHWEAYDDGYLQWVSEDTKRMFSVNIGKLPYERRGSCLGHNRSNKIVPQGIISLTEVQLANASVVEAPLSTWGRDHPFIKYNKPIPLEKWIFIYDELAELDKLDLQKCIVMQRTLFNYAHQVFTDLYDHIYAMSVSYNKEI
jgi:hypothetical protein